MTPRVIPNTQWTRDRYNFFLIDEDGTFLVDEDGTFLIGLTDTLPIVTSWT